MLRMLSEPREREINDPKSELDAFGVCKEGISALQQILFWSTF